MDSSENQFSWKIRSGIFPFYNVTLKAICWEGCVVNESRTITRKSLLQKYKHFLFCVFKVLKSYKNFQNKHTIFIVLWYTFYFVLMLTDYKTRCDM